LLTRLGEHLALGYTHVVPNGLDHILFVAALFLLRARARPVLMQLATFTCAHSIALAASLYDISALPARVTAPLMAVFIVYVAIDNLRTQTVSAVRVAVVFVFALLHGLGFAATLNSLPLTPSSTAVALLGFNAGVELGQVTVVGAVALIVRWWRQRDWYHARVAVPASIVIACIGAYWTVLRTLQQ
jgi:hypothetical protein